ncbi:efflux RND transporter periplasmic adaptor subunit, partial [Herbaspirillum sp. B65]|uniref:efflux RND transporter periplasmic adaptor subunit n=1 Tax=Herbaspirillum sp. B65 TaxID=137708 RepID=UPI0005CA2884
RSGLPQELDERRSAFAQASSNLAAADANVERLRQVEGFKRIVAPFSGIITRRNVDVGDLIDPGAGRSLFVLSQTDPLRVYVNVPQSYANLVKPGQQVTVSQAELRGRKFEGKVARTAGSIDPVTRSMQIEVTLSNADNALLPGAFVQVALPLKPSGTLLVAADTLMFRRDGSLVAAVDEHNRVRLKKVRLGRNFGLTVEVLEGLNGNEKLILNPSDSLAEGDQVEPTLEQPEQKQKAAS